MSDLNNNTHWIKKYSFNRLINKSLKNQSPSLPAWTLTEILIVLAIIGILVLLVLPNQTAVISKAKAKEAQLQLNALYNMELSYFYERSKYSNDFNEIGFIQEKLTTDGGNANYRIEFSEFSPSGFKAIATAVVDFDNDGVFNIWQIDHERNMQEIVKD
jgi:type IV pilus assembly protein PilE